MTSPAGRPAWFRWAALTIVVASAALRIGASLNELWLDEILSLNLADSLSSPLEILTRGRQDNNHPLNTLLLWALGERDSGLVYRLPSVLAGVGTVLLSGWLTRSRGRLEILSVMALTGSSFLLVQYSSEARGYALAVFFAFLTWGSAERMQERPGWAAAAAFSLSSVLGFLSHLSFAQFYLAVLLWTGWAFPRRRDRRMEALTDLARCHLVPCLFVAALYVAFVRHLQILGGPEESLPGVLSRVLGLSGGAPVASVLMLPAAVLTVLLAGTGLRCLLHEGSDRWLLFLAVLVVGPAAVLIAWRPVLLFERYFLVSAAFLPLLFGHVLADEARSGNLRRPLAAATMLLIVGGNLWNVFGLLRDGRGDYLGALAEMSRSAGPRITVATDHRFRQQTMLEYYDRFRADRRPVRFAGSPPEWFLGHSQDPAFVPAAEVPHPSGKPYRLVRVFPAYGPSGWRLFLYRREDATPPD